MRPQEKICKWQLSDAKSHDNDNMMNVVLSTVYTTHIHTTYNLLLMAYSKEVPTRRV